MKQLCGVVWPCINIRLCPPPIITSPTLHSARKPHYTFLHHAKWYLPVPVVPKPLFRSYGYNRVTPALAILFCICFWPPISLVVPRFWPSVSWHCSLQATEGWCPWMIQILPSYRAPTRSYENKYQTWIYLDRIRMKLCCCFVTPLLLGSTSQLLEIYRWGPNSQCPNVNMANPTFCYHFTIG